MFPGIRRWPCTFQEFNRAFFGANTSTLPCCRWTPRAGEGRLPGPQVFPGVGGHSRALPMHQWQDFGFTAKFLEEFPQFAGRVVPISHVGQEFLLP